MIRCADPGAEYRQFREEIDAVIHRVLTSGSYILGEEVSSFELEFAAFLGGGTAVGVASGTDAIELALRALGVQSGDAVLTVSFTSNGTVAAIERCGAIPVLADIDPATFTLSTESAERCVRHFKDLRFKVILPVHLYGQPANMRIIQSFAHDRSLFIVEDCAQAHGSMWQGRPVGTLGDVAAFSFYPTKNLGALGDGGAVFTRCGEIAEKARMHREFGWERRYVSEIPGINSRLDELQAAVLRVKLIHLEAQNLRRRGIAARYDSELLDSVIIPFVSPECSLHVYHQYAIRTSFRGELKSFLAERGVEASVLYPTPIHRQPAYVSKCRMDPNGLPASERAAREVLCLPVHPQVTDVDAASVISSVRDFISSQHRELAHFGR